MANPHIAPSLIAFISLGIAQPISVCVEMRVLRLLGRATNAAVQKAPDPLVVDPDHFWRLD